tara:strand:- start:463 stop:759 length:297 start_codon:yes stop_codon:yes gene_type:complete
VRDNLRKKDIINSIYMQIGFSKKISETLLDEFFSIILEHLKENKKVKISKFGTFSVKLKKEREGRNPKTKKTALISARKTVSFKASKELKNYINNKDE